MCIDNELSLVLSSASVQETPVLSEHELMVLLKRNPEIAQRLLEMTNAKAKKLYVEARHKNKVSQMTSKSRTHDGHWWTHIYVDGKRKAVEKSTEDELYSFLFDFYHGQEERTKSFEEVFEMFVQDKRSRGRTESTISEYRRYFSFLPEDIRNKDIALITEDELRTWFVNDYLRRNPKKEALKKMIQLIRAAFSYGTRKSYCFGNPAQDILIEDYVKLCDLSGKANEEKSFSEEELGKLKQYCLEHSTNPHAAVMLLAMETGMRMGELTALRKEDIREGYIIVHRQQTKVPKTDNNAKAYFSEVEYTKNERTNPRGGRPIPITEECQKALDVALSLPGESEYVFHHPDGSPVLKDSYGYYLRRVCARLSIATSNNHAFRVAFNAKLINAGVDGNERCLVLGHSMQTNERHYSFSDKRKADDVRDKLNSLKMAL